MSASARETVVLGRITGVYGVRGWVRVQSYTEPEENLLGYANCRLQRDGHWQSIAIDAGRTHGKGLVLHLEGVDDRDAAAALKGSEIVVGVDELPALAGGEYYWHQLEGLRVLCGEELLGRVDHLLETGSNDVIVVRPCEGSRDQRERLLPWLVGPVILGVDLDAGVIRVEWDPEF